MEKKTANKLRRYPYFFGILSIGIICILVQIIMIVDCFKPFITYETDAVSSVMSTCSEVIAGMYGITLTGYIFFADRFQDTSRDDESLYDAVEALLLRYNHMASIISILTLICVMMNEGIVLYGSNQILPQWAHRFWISEALLLSFMTFNFIMYFVISVLDPKKISRISAQRKAEISKDQTSGDREAFMADWAAIEKCLRDLLENLFSTLYFVPGSRHKPEMIHTLETLRNYGRIGPSLWKNLEKLRQYHNLTLHDPTMDVSGEMCDLAKSVRAELESKK